VIAADLVVVGAGPAGASAATVAARAGLSVLLVDRAVFPRDKCCGDGLTTDALRRLESLGIDPGRLRSWQPVREARVRIADGREARLSLPDDAVYAATVRRVELDAALVTLAQRAGVRVEQGCAARSVRVAADGRGVEVDLDGGETARSWYVIGADGMWSPLRKALGPASTPYLGEWHALRQYLQGTGPEARRLWVWFEDDLRPGYAWSFPLPGDRVNVGFGIRRGGQHNVGRMRELWEDLLTREHIASVLGPGASPEGPLKTWPIPARIGSGGLSALDGRVLFAGDAARAPDCMTGEGIAQALATGALAAQTVAAWGPHAPGRAGEGYRSALRRGMGVDDVVSAAFSRVLASRRGSRAWFEIANATERTRRHFARWMFEDYPRAALITPWRWRSGLLSEGGAYRVDLRQDPTPDQPLDADQPLGAATPGSGGLAQTRAATVRPHG
jgi:geranylgeranyl reductase family protein